MQKVLDGEEWCETCGAYRRYRSHGWTAKAATSKETDCCADACIVDQNTGAVIMECGDEFDPDLLYRIEQSWTMFWQEVAQ